MRRVRRIADSEWYAWWRRVPLATDTVLWSSFDGAAISCQPRALFDAVLSDPRYAHLQHAWVIDEDLRGSAAVRAMTEHPRVTTTVHGSPSYLRALATAHVLVTNTAFAPRFSKRRGQVYLNTRHGVPLDDPAAPEDLRSAANTMRNLLQADYLLSSGPWMTRTVYEGTYRLGNIYPGTILEAGSPRTDVLFDDGAPERLRRALARHGRDPGRRRLAVLAPAVRGREEGGTGEVERLQGYLGALRGALGPQWVALLALPEEAPRELGDAPALREAVVPASIGTPLLLSGTDLLVAGRPGLLPDYLPRDRPVILLAPVGPGPGSGSPSWPAADALPGPEVRDAEGLAAAASHVAARPDGFEAERRAWRERYCPHDDGRVAPRVIDIVFGGRTNPRVERTLPPDGRTRLLLHLGGMKRNGITSSALNLLRNLDYERVDVTCYFLDSPDPERLASAADVDPRARILLRSGGFTSTKLDYVRARWAYTRGVQDPASLPRGLQEVFAEEWARCFGSAQFDRIADFSGYGAMWGLILLSGPAPLHGIWLHNEMLADSQRIVHGRRPLARRLHAVFTLYRAMDRLVSVSPALRELNREELAAFAPPERFVYARNTLDFDRIDELAAAPVREGDEAGAAVMRWLSERRAGSIFVTAARLSSEKNQERLIRAFAMVRRTHPDASLLVLGDGALRGHLEELVDQLGLGKACLIAGFHPNPFQFMRHCDCFVLSSDHEGQPMVILEALDLGLQVITTRFSSVDSALPPGVGLIVDRDVHALAEGMDSYLDHGLGPVTFDSAAYNAEAVDEFYAALAVPPNRSLPAGGVADRTSSQGMEGQWPDRSS